MHPVLARRIVYPLLHWRMGRQSPRTVAELERTQWLDFERIRELQWSKVRALLAHVYANVPYYRGLFRDLGLRPEDVRSLDDLQWFPVLTKQVVQERGPELLAQAPTGLLKRTTSGSTGAPMVSYVDRRCQEWWLAAERRRRRWWGVDIGSREASLSADPVPRKLWLARYYLQNEGTFSSVDLSEDGMARLYRRLVRFRPVSFRGYPSTLAHFARFMLNRRGRLGRLPLRVVWCTAEVLYPDQRAVMHEAFGAPVVNEYGSTENELLAVECPAGQMHIMAENHYLEFRPASPGAADLTEIVITDLNNYGMPFIRYAIGDLGRGRPEACPCGRGLPLLELMGGRVADLAILPDGRHMDNTVFCEVFERLGPARVRQYRIVQEALDRFTILIAGAADAGVRETVLREFRRILGPGVAIEIYGTSEIVREPSGKLRHFVSRLTHPSIRHRQETAPQPVGHH